MNPKSQEARSREENPFEGMDIAGAEPLNALISRSPCTKCGKSRMYFCYTCFVPVAQIEGQIPLCRVS